MLGAAALLVEATRAACLPGTADEPHWHCAAPRCDPTALLAIALLAACAAAAGLAWLGERRRRHAAAERAAPREGGDNNSADAAPARESTGKPGAGHPSPPPSPAWEGEQTTGAHRAATAPTAWVDVARGRHEEPRTAGPTATREAPATRGTTAATPRNRATPGAVQATPAKHPTHDRPSGQREAAAKHRRRTAQATGPGEEQGDQPDAASSSTVGATTTIATAAAAAAGTPTPEATATASGGTGQAAAAPAAEATTAAAPGEPRQPTPEWQRRLNK
eukprot:scaffold63477_cov51-Phaeocystis_antarctica.AAC.1